MSARDPRVDPQAGDVLRWTAGGTVHVCLVEHVTRGLVRCSVTSDEARITTQVSIWGWRDWSDVPAGRESVAVLWPLPDAALREQVAALTAERDAERARADRLARVLTDVREWAAPALHVPPPDDLVHHLTEAAAPVGAYGAAMSDLSAHWRRADPVGGFVVGPCAGTVCAWLDAMLAADAAAEAP